MIGSLAITEPGGGSDVAGIRDDRRPRRRPLRRQRRQDVHHQRRARRLRHHRRAHRRARATRGISLLVVEKGTPGFTVDRSLAKMGWHCSDTAELAFVDVRVPVAQPGRRGEHRLRADRRAVRGRADRARGARLRHRRPQRSRSPRRTAASARRSASRWSPTRSCGTGSSRCTGRSRSPAPTPARSPRGTSPARTSSPRRCLAKQTAVEACDVRLRPGRAAARRHGLPARDRGGAALPRRPDPADRRRSDRGADRPGRASCWGTPMRSSLRRASRPR